MSGLEDLVARKRAARERRLRGPHGTGIHLKLAVPGEEWAGDMVLRYEIQDYGGSVEHDADLLTRLCTRVYLRDEEWEGKLVSLLDDAGQPVGLDARLTAKLGRPDITDARDVVRYVFGEGNDTELSDHAVSVWAWVRNTATPIPGEVTHEAADHEEAGDSERPTQAGSPADGQPSAQPTT